MFLFFPIHSILLQTKENNVKKSDFIKNILNKKYFMDLIIIILITKFE